MSDRLIDVVSVCWIECCSECVSDRLSEVMSVCE